MAGQPAGGVAVVCKARDAEMRKFMGSRFAPLQGRDTRGQRSSERDSVRSSSAEAEPATWKPKPAPPPGKPPQWQQSTAESAAARPDRYSTRPKPPPPDGPPPPLTQRESELGSPPPLTQRESELGRTSSLVSKRESDLGRTLTLTPRHSQLPAPEATADPTARPPPPKMGALPAGWSVARDPEGYPYYYNLSTGENTYDRPGGVPPPPPKAKPPPPPADMVEGCATSSAAPEAEPSAAPAAADSSAAPVAAEPSAAPVAAGLSAVPEDGPTEEEEAAALWGRCGLSLVDEATPLAPPPLATSEPGAAPAAALEAASPTTAALSSADAPAVAPDEGRPISPPPLDEQSASSSFMLLGKMVRSAKSLVATPGGAEDARAARKASLRAADHLEADADRDATRSRPTRQFRRRKVKASEAVLEGHGAGGAATPGLSSASCPPAAMEPTMPAAPKRAGRRSTLGASLAGVRARVRGSVRGSVVGMPRRSVAGPPTSLPTSGRNDLSKRAVREMASHFENAT